MASFDVSKDWAILVPPGIPAARKAADDLSRCVGALRKRAGPGFSSPPLVDAHGAAPSDETPVIILNTENNGPEKNGFSWRIGAGRLEIYGESARGLCNGVYDFLGALGIKWPAPDREILPVARENPPGRASAVFPLEPSDACRPSRFEGGGIEKAPWRRFVVRENDPALGSKKKREALAAWAARNSFDVLIFPLKLVCRRAGALMKLAGEYALVVEAGGRELSVLVPRRLFSFHKELFRMEEGKRRKQINFCPTSPDSIRIIRAEGGKIFRAAGRIKVFHLWPDRSDENAWCACPTCRAFTPTEQYRIAVNAAADVLAEINPDAKISFYEKPGEGGAIPLRPNLFNIEALSYDD